MFCRNHIPWDTVPAYKMNMDFPWMFAHAVRALDCLKLPLAPASSSFPDTRFSPARARGSLLSRRATLLLRLSLQERLHAGPYRRIEVLLTDAFRQSGTREHLLEWVIRPGNDQDDPPAFKLAL